MRQGLALPIAAVLLAIAVTTTLDATGLAAFSSLVLVPLLALFWFLDRMPRREAGFTWGRPADYALAIAFPLLVMGFLAALAAASGALELSRTDWTKALVNIAVLTVATVLTAIITEEGFFRGWLWGALGRRGVGPVATLAATTFAFTAWHISVVVLPTGFDLPASQVPVYLANAALIGAVWGLLRWRSGSMIVSSVSHGVWNGLAYVLFGFGTHVGALGIRDTAFFGPEVGLAGLALNAVVLAAAGWWCSRRPAAPAAA